jgi:hypothetical protein
MSIVVPVKSPLIRLASFCAPGPSNARNFAPTCRPFRWLYGVLAALSSGSGEELTSLAQYALLGSFAPGGRVRK